MWVEERRSWPYNGSRIDSSANLNLERSEIGSRRLEKLCLSVFIYNKMGHANLCLRAQVKKLKMEIKNKFYIESITIATFKTLNVQVPRKIFYIWLLNFCPKGRS